MEETREEPSLLPSNSLLRVRTRQIVEIANSGIQPMQSLKNIIWIEKHLGKEKKLEWARERIKSGLAAAEAVSREIFGKTVSGMMSLLQTAVLRLRRWELRNNFR